AAPGLADRLLEEVWTWADKTAAPGGGRMLDEPWVQLALARAYAKLEAVKVMGTEFFVECYRLLLEIVGAAGIVEAGEPGALFGGLLEQAYRGATTLTFGGGVNEVQRDIIAMAGLGLPRAQRR